MLGKDEKQEAEDIRKEKEQLENELFSDIYGQHCEIS